MIQSTAHKERMEVCGPCGGPVGPFRDRRGTRPLRSYVQRGSCPLHAAPRRQRGWDGFDFDEGVALCRCCGAVALRSGHRFSVWFCDACKQEVGLLNGRHGRYVVPIGRHSVHAGCVLTSSDVMDLVRVQIFSDAFVGAAGAMTVLREWAGEAVRLTLAEIGIAPDGRVSLPEYLNRARAVVDKAERFRQMCLYLDRVGRERLAPR